MLIGLEEQALPPTAFGTRASVLTHGIWYTANGSSYGVRLESLLPGNLTDFDHRGDSNNEQTATLALPLNSRQRERLTSIRKDISMSAVEGSCRPLDEEPKDACRFRLLDEGVFGLPAKRLKISDGAWIGRQYFQSSACWHVLNGFFSFQDRQGAVQSFGVEGFVGHQFKSPSPVEDDRRGRSADPTITAVGIRECCWAVERPARSQIGGLESGGFFCAGHFASSGATPGGALDGSGCTHSLGH